ncbi:MAG: hypothetical protein AAGB31_01100 [Bdellovibrio sp.]
MPRAFILFVILSLFWTPLLRAEVSAVEGDLLNKLEERVESYRLREARRLKKQQQIEASWRHNSDYSIAGDLLTFGSYEKGVEEDLFNPGNQVYQWPRSVLGVDAAIDARVKVKDVQAVLRPRWQYFKREIPLEPGSQVLQSDENKWSLQEGYLDWRWGDGALIAGLHKFSWGPAEMMSPSNFIFHFERDETKQNYRPKGRTLLRVNWQFTPSSNVVGIVEAAGNGEASWLYDQEQKTAGLLKYEWVSSENSLNYIGLVGGRSQEAQQDAGFYLNWNIGGAVSFYIDTRASEKRAAYRPSLVSGAMQLSSVEKEDTEILGIAGLRWEGAVDVRLEYLHNSAGYSDTEKTQVLSALAVSNPFLALNIKKLLGSGLELPLREYAYLSVRKDERGTDTNWALYLRDVYSMEEKNHYIQAGGEWELISNLLIYFEGSYLTPRQEDSLLSQVLSDNLTLGLRYFF